ncbi:winged helix-turn-helix domain-containing protein [Massilia sp. YIM B04103]|uniref:nSTAND1 domain-containing NTPase n=1 Tax=Massilia sp. YIM B04103 TaxID=2963106 RepID=UPI00210CD15D|nr:winged helix-turn-helix domain-containing protein [Massilia sp. YIM B04103]
MLRDHAGHRLLTHHQSNRGVMLTEKQETCFLLEHWRVNVAARQLESEECTVPLEPLVMAILHYLCTHPMEIVSSETLLAECWGNTAAGDNPVHKAIAVLRKALGDSSRSPRYIETIRMRGYRLVARVQLLSEYGPRDYLDAWGRGSPFMGLASFDSQHAGVFFGRDGAIAELYERLAQQLSRGFPMVVVLGASGSGKTSLVQAGLIPLLQQKRALRSAELAISSYAVLDLADSEREDLFCLMAGSMLDWDSDGQAILSGYSIDGLATQLRDDMPGVIRHLRLGLAPLREQSAMPLLVLDSLESLFTKAPPSVLEPWLVALGDLIRSRLILVIALCRNDFYASLTQHPIFMEDKTAQAHMDLLPPNFEALAQIVRLPAQAAGLHYGRNPSGLQRLDDRICGDALHARDSLPLLQYTLQTLYEAQEPGGLLSWAAYDALGGIEGAITTRAEAILNSLPEAQQNAFPLLLPKLISTSAADTTPTARWCAHAELQSAIEQSLVEALVEARLLTTAQYHGARSFRLAHEALLRRWQRITNWLNQHKSALIIRDELSSWVNRWLAAERAKAFLLPNGQTLWKAQSTKEQFPFLFTGEMGEYLSLSCSSIQRRDWLRRSAAFGAICLTVLAVLAAVRYARVAEMAEHREWQSRRLSSFMLGELADRLRPIGKLDLLESVGDEGLSVLGALPTENEAPQDVLQRAKSLVVIAEVHSTRGKGSIATAIRSLDEADRLLALLEARQGILLGDYYKILGASAFWRGQIAFDQGNLPEAEKAMLAYRDASLRWQKAKPDDRDAGKELGFALNSLGSIAVRGMRWEEAGRYFESALAAKQAALAAQPGDAELIHGVVNAQSWLSQSKHALGQDEQALALSDAALKLEASLYQSKPDEKMRLHELAVLHVRRSEALTGLGRYDEAITALEQGRAWLTQAVENDSHNLRWRAERVHLAAGLLLIRLEKDPALPARPELGILNALINTEAEALDKQARLKKETLIRMGIIEAGVGLHERRWDLAKERIDTASKLMDELLRQSNPSWQNIELIARLALLHKQWLMQASAPVQAVDDACQQLQIRRGTMAPLANAAIVIKARNAVSPCLEKPPFVQTNGLE